jgi:predicted PurR-regulated permease PerM
VVRVNEAPFDVTPYLVRGVGSVGGAMIVGVVVPFLMFFMLVRKEHIYWWASTTFGKKTDIAQFAEKVSGMVGAFVTGNVIVGSIMAALMVPILLSIKLDGAVELGIISGFLNLVPYVGAVLACLPVLVAATLQFSHAEPFVVIVLATVLLHVISANVLIPRLIGSRVNLDPVAAIAGMLFWTWLWGPFGLLLAVPLTAFVRLVADCHPALAPVSNLLAKNPRPTSGWARAREMTFGRAIPYIRERFRAGPKGTHHT